MPENNEVSLRDYLESRLLANENALKLARTELERRLDDLNKLRADVVEDRANFVTAELYNAAEHGRTTWRETIRDDLSKLGDRVTIIETRSVTWVASLGVVLTIMQFLGGFILYWLVHSTKP